MTKGENNKGVGKELARVWQGVGKGLAINIISVLGRGESGLQHSNWWAGVAQPNIFLCKGSLLISHCLKR